MRRDTLKQTRAAYRMKMSKLNSYKRELYYKREIRIKRALTLSERVSTCHFLKDPATLQKHIRFDTHIDACNPPEIDNDGYLDANNENKISFIMKEFIPKERNVGMYFYIYIYKSVFVCSFTS